MTNQATQAEPIDDSNVLLFTRANFGKEFTYYITNLYIGAARHAGISMPTYLELYTKHLLTDPEQVQGDANLLRLYELFDWSIKEILDEINPELAEEKPVDKILHARTAIIYIVREMFADYNIKRE